jgi:YVTN family beta-propeller protein
MRKSALVLVVSGISILFAGCASSFFLVGCKSAKQPPPEPTTAQIPPSTGPRVYVTNEVSGDLTIIDAEARKAIATIPLGKRPRGIHPSPDGKTLYVALSGSPIGGPDVDESTLPPADHTADGIGVFDVAQDKLVRTLKAGNDPENFDVSQDGKQIYVSNEDDAEVSIIDVASGTVVKSYKMGAQPEGVKVAPDGKLVFVTSEETSTISVLDPAADKIVSTFKVGHRPRSIAFMPGGKFGYVNAENDGTVVEFDAVRHRVLKEISLGKPGLIKPMCVILSADASRLYASTGRGQQVFTIDTATNKPIASVTVGKRPWGIALSADGKTLYSANGPSNNVSVVDLASNTVTATIPAGTGPWGVVVLPH